MLRLFIAINLNSSIIEQIQNICFGVKNARWLPADQMHLTLRFIGKCDNDLFRNIQSTLEHVRIPAFSLAGEDVGYFPPRGKPRVLWVGIKPSPELQALRAAIDKCLNQIGIPEERKKFHPHITVARLRDNSSPATIIPFLTQNSLFKIDAFQVNNFYLYSSILRQEGAIHRIEETYPLL